MPAQLNNTSTLPRDFASAAMAAGSRTSSMCPSQPATFFSALPSISAAMTRAPARAKPSALARPIPDAAAVTNAVLPANRLDSISCSCCSGVNLFAFASREFRQQPIADVAPLFVRADELAHGPVAAPHHARRPKAVEQVLDRGFECRDIRATGFGDEPGELAHHRRRSREF